LALGLSAQHVQPRLHVVLCKQADLWAIAVGDAYPQVLKCQQLGHAGGGAGGVLSLRVHGQLLPAAQQRIATESQHGNLITVRGHV